MSDELVVSVCPSESHPEVVRVLDRESVPDAVKALHRMERERGFVSYDADRIEFYRFLSGRGPAYWAQLVAERRSRPQEPAACPLCIDSVKQTGQLYVALTVGGSLFYVLANPYAFLPSGLTIAAATHRPQSWRHDDVADRAQAIYDLVLSVVALASSLRECCIIWNGPRAGASLPQHWHAQAGELPEGHGLLPIKQVTLRRRRRPGFYGLAGEYPLLFHYARGDPKVVTTATAAVVNAWDQLQGQAATGNLAAIAADDEIELWFAPRNRLQRKSPVLNGAIGTLEVCGSFVLCADWEFQALREGRITHESLHAALLAVRPELADRLAEVCTCQGSNAT